MSTENDSRVSGDDDTSSLQSNSNSLEYQPDSKDEYLEDPLPDLVGNLKINEEPEPDLTALHYEQEFTLEEFELSTNTSDEEEEEYIEDSGSDLEFFDVENEFHVSHSEVCDAGGSCDLPENEKVSVEMGEQNYEERKNAEGPSSSTGKKSRIKEVKEKAEKVASTVRGIVGKRRSKLHKNIRVLYQNLDKPYTAKVSPSQHFKKFLTLGQESQSMGSAGGMSQSGSLNSLGGVSGIEVGMSAEEVAAVRAEWQAELNQIEDEMQTLKQVLNAKTRRAHELKRKLGVTSYGEFMQDMGQGIKNVRESPAVQKIEETITTVQEKVVSAPLYQKTESAIKATAERTTSLLGGIGSAMSQKLGALKNTESFRSMEERVSSAVSTVKTKMGGSRSGSVQNFDEALREATANQAVNPDGTRPNGTPTPAATPVVEEKPIS